jgi:hypothetical protein
LCVCVRERERERACIVSIHHVTDARNNITITCFALLQVNHFFPCLHPHFNTHQMALSTDATSRPARKQVAKDKVLGPQASGPTRSVGGGGAKPGQTYNIYYDKWTGGSRTDRSDQGSSKEKSLYRCDPVKDTGITKGTYNPNAYFCAFFAKGCCPYGYVDFNGWLVIFCLLDIDILNVGSMFLTNQ